MTRKSRVALVLLSALLLLLGGCEELGIAPADGDQPGDGDSTDGDSLDGDILPDGDSPDGDTLPDGDAPVDGDSPDGDTDGDGADGDAPDGDTDGDGPDGDADGDGPDCTPATAGLDCPDSLGCVDGLCAPCVEAGHCPSTFGCRDGLCGPCEQAEECRPGEACRNALCGICTLPTQCREMEGCRDGLCGPCIDPYDCMGLLCVDGSCLTCSEDDPCQEQYNEAFGCESGICVRRSCQDDVDCRLQGEICPPATHLCSPCLGTYDCLQSIAYGSGYQCLNGRCSEGNCRTNEDCVYDAPVCSEINYCRGCQATNQGAHAECRGRFGPDWICTPQGACVIGNCLATPDCAAINSGLCPTGAVEDGDLDEESDVEPATPYTCRPCVDMVEDMACRQEYGLDNLICSAGSCVVGNCHDDSDCEPVGMVCDTDNSTCVQCLTQAHCETPEGNERICWNRQCRDCVWGECGEGKVCGGGVCHVGDCWIDGAVWRNGESDPANVCKVCNANLNPLAWSANSGVSCDDGQACTHSDTCSAAAAGQCVGVQYTCSAPGSISTCAKGVCHGTGPSDCTYEMKEGWTGCFMIGNPNDPDTGVCTAAGANNPANECETCNATNNTWQNKNDNMKCGGGAICRVCKVQGNGISQCVNVSSNTDPNNDCTLNCQVCNGSGACAWAEASTNPEGNCVASNVSTCGLNGNCAGGSSACAYWPHGSGSGVVNDGEECTTPDFCDGTGGKTGTAKANGTLCANNTRVCKGGYCQECHSTNNPCPSGYVCDNGQCYQGNCTPSDMSSCPAPPACKRKTCNNYTCGTTNDNTLSCTDGKTCTTDTCQSGSCVSTINNGYCLISGTCYQENYLKPGTTCSTCQPTASKTWWSQDNSRCNDYVECTYDVCNPDGTCSYQGRDDYCSDQVCRDYYCRTTSPKGCAWVAKDEGQYCLHSSGGGYCAGGTCADRFSEYTCYASGGNAYKCARDIQNRRLYYVSGSTDDCANTARSWTSCRDTCDSLVRYSGSGGTGTAYSNWRMIGAEVWGIVWDQRRTACNGGNVYIDSAFTKVRSDGYGYWLAGCDANGNCSTYNFASRTSTYYPASHSLFINCLCVHDY